MPEHSTEYIVPSYDVGEDVAGEINGFVHKWPYYYQTSRDPKDQGFEWQNNGLPYDNPDNKLHGCVLHPYFEVKLSSKTTGKIGGYAIVRVPRDSQNRTIVTSGILSRAIQYSNDSEYGEHPLKGRYGNTTFPLWTEVEQSEKERFDDGKCTVYTIDSPDAFISSNFTLSSGSNRIKIVESGFCQKQNISFIGEEWNPYILSACDLADGTRNNDDGDETDGPNWNPFDIKAHSINAFASTLDKDLLMGGEVLNDIWDGGLEIDVGGWEFSHTFNSTESGTGSLEAPTAQDIEGDDCWFTNITTLYVDDMENYDNTYGNVMGTMKMGYQTKYYSKRISCYPQYGMFGNQTSEIADSLGYINQDNIRFDDDEKQTTSNLPFTQLGAGDGDAAASNNRPKDYLDQGYIDDFIPLEITFQKVVNPNEEVSMVDLNTDTNYRNGHFFMEDFGMANSRFNREQKHADDGVGPFGADDFSTIQESGRYAENSKTIVCSIDGNVSGMMPIVRQNIDNGNKHEDVNGKLGWHRPPSNTDNWPTSEGAGHWSPEVTIASIHKLQSRETLYGGDTTGNFAKNVFQLTGHFTPVRSSDIGEVKLDVGQTKGASVFGGDTYIGYHAYKKTWNSDSSASTCVCFGLMAPLECEFNLDLRDGLYWGSNSYAIPRYIPDDTNYNWDFDSENNALSLIPQPIDWKGAEEWPSTIAWSEVKMTGEIQDSFAIFPVNQIRDLDYNRGPITQMFNLNDKLFALQHSGTCLLSVNPRVLIPTQDGAAIEATTGSGKAIERHDYLSNFGSQHFHGLAVSNAAAYYYDDDNCKFLRLGRGQKGGFGVISLGETGLMQSFFNSFKNLVINDLPLTNLLINQPSSNNYELNINTAYESSESGLGGISLGYDPEFSEILLTIMAENHQPKTIVFNENLNSFTSFISKIPADYFNYKGRLYSTYNVQESDSIDELTSLNKVYLANGEGVGPQNNYLNFAGIDYYIWDYTQEVEILEDLSESPLFVQIAGEDTPDDPTDDEFLPVMEEIHKEPFEIEMVFNDIPTQSKIFDKIQLSMNSDTEAGYRYNYFRKFVFRGGANINNITQLDDGSDEFANTDNIGNSSIRTWYSVKDGFHFVPMRAIDGPNGPQGKVRGNFATARLTMGWAEDDSHPSGANMNIKNEKFNIFSVVPFFRASRV